MKDPNAPPYPRGKERTEAEALDRIECLVAEHGDENSPRAIHAFEILREVMGIKEVRRTSVLYGRPPAPPHMPQRFIEYRLKTADSVGTWELMQISPRETDDGITELVSEVGVRELGWSEHYRGFEWRPAASQDDGPAPGDDAWAAAYLHNVLEAAYRAANRVLPYDSAGNKRDPVKVRIEILNAILALQRRAPKKALQRRVRKPQGVNMTDQASIEAEMLRVSAAEGDPETEMPVRRELLLRVMTSYQALASEHGTEVTEKMRDALENCRLYAARNRTEPWSKTILGYCEQAGIVGSPLRSDDA